MGLRWGWEWVNDDNIDRTPLNFLTILGNFHQYEVSDLLDALIVTQLCILCYNTVIYQLFVAPSLSS